MPAAETDVILGDLGVLLLECGTSVTDVRGSLEQVSRRAAPETTLEFAILPEMVMVSRPGAASPITRSLAGCWRWPWSDTRSLVATSDHC